MVIKIIDYSTSKIPLSLRIHKYLMDKEIDFYLDNDWVNGPSISVILKNKNIESELIDELKQIVSIFKTNHPVSYNIIREKKELYKREYERLNALELRRQKEIKLFEDGYVFISQKKKGIYNSKIHQEMFEKMKFKLQGIHGCMLNLLQQMDENKKIKLFVEQFKYIANLYNGDIREGYISYVSHVGGFIARAKKEGINVDFKNKFYKYYIEYNNKKIKFNSDEMKVLEKWKRVWNEINEDFKFDDSLEPQGEEYISYNRQFKMLEEYIKGIDSEFHNKLFRKEDVKNFILSDKMIHYRNVINLFYSTLPLFEQGMLMKHFYGYIVIQDIQAEYKDLIFYL